jgi:hypothetical protein
LPAISNPVQELSSESIDWTKFEAEFQGTYPGFRTKLMYLSERSVERHRYSIRKKLGLNGGEDLHTLLAAI